MSEYEVNWAVGGRAVITATTLEDAHVQARELLPRDCAEWQDIDVIPVEENSKTVLS
jgi:hypothetical protein